MKLKYSQHLLLSCVCAVPLLLRAEVITVSGKGQCPVAAAKKNGIAAANQTALAAAQEAARADGITQALFQAYGNIQKLGPNAPAIIQQTIDHAAAMVLDTQVVKVDIQGGVAIAESVLKVDAKAMRDYLEHSLGLSLAQESEGQYRFFVLAYTVEGADPNRSQPQVLQSDVTEDKKNVQASSDASTQTSAGSASFSASNSSDATQAAASTHAASLQGNYASSDNGQARYKSDASVNLSAKASESASANERFGSDRASADYAGSVAAKLKASASESASAAWDRKDSGSVDTRESATHNSFQHSASSASAAGEQADYEHSAHANSKFSDTSTYYHKLVVYADTTKKGSGSSNEVRAKLGEMLKQAGLTTGFLDANLMGRTFNNEDELYHEILLQIRANPDVKEKDYVAVALNRFTPVDLNGHRYSSQVTYRVLRIRDGDIFLPDKDVTGDSGDQPSDDMARSIATELALKKTDEVLPGEIVRALRQTHREAQRDADAAATSYDIRLDNIGNPVVSSPIKQALRQAGFGVKFQFRGEAHSESIFVSLNGKSGADVLTVLESLVANFDVVTMDEHQTVLRNK